MYMEPNAHMNRIDFPATENIVQNWALSALWEYLENIADMKCSVRINIYTSEHWKWLSTLHQGNSAKKYAQKCVVKVTW